jgi:ABC-2 type transport system permease protein
MAVEAAAPPGAGRAGIAGPLVAHAFRTIRVSTAVWFAGLTAVGLVIVATYESAYPTAPERAVFAAQIEGNPSFEALLGPARDIDTVGGFAVWRINGVAVLLAAVWALLATARLTRGEEDAGHAELLAAGAVRRQALLAGALVVVVTLSGVLAAVVTGSLLAAGLDLAHAALVGGGQGLSAATMAALTGVGAQLGVSRGRTITLAGGVLAAAYLARVLATGADIGWLAWATPVGWASELGYDPGPVPLVPFALAIPLLAAVALVLAGRRDLGATALGYPTHAARGGPLRSPAALARRLVRPAMLGWTALVGAYALVIGLLTRDMLEFLRESPGLVELAAQLGLGPLDRAEGVLGFGFAVFVFFVALAAAQQAAAIREEEASGRLETLAVLPLGRAAWLGGRVAASAGALVVVAAAAGLGAWVGVVARGESVDPWRLALAAANLLPVALLFLGLAVAAFGLRPRATAPLAWGLVIGSFLVEFVGSLLELPRWVLSLSPFHHVQPAPAVDPALGASLVLLALAATGVAVGLAAFRRRDLVGA